MNSRIWNNIWKGNVLRRAAGMKLLFCASLLLTSAQPASASAFGTNFAAIPFAASYGLSQPEASYAALMSSLLSTSTGRPSNPAVELSLNEKRNLLQAAQKAAFSLDWTNAAELASFVSRPSDESGWQATVLEGYAYLQVGQPEAALAGLERAFLSMPSDDASLKPFVGYWLTQAALESGHPGAAFVIGQFVDASALPVQLRTDLAMLIARAGAQRCQSVEDVQALRATLHEYPAYPYVATATTEIAACLRTLGRPDLAANELEQLDRELPWLPVVQSALLRHEQETGDSVHAFSIMDADEHIEWIRSIRISRNWSLAEAEFQRFLATHELETLPDSTANELWFQRALNAYESAKFTTATTYFAEISDSTAGVDRWLVTKYWALSQSRLGEQVQALARIEEYCATYQRPSCTDDIFEFAWDFGLYEQAEQMLTSGQVSPLDPLQPGLLQFLRQDFESARHTFASLASNSAGHDGLQATYWQARSLQQLGNTAAAAALFSSIVEARPFDYYALLSRGQLVASASETEPEDESSGVGAMTGPGFRLHWGAANDASYAAALPAAVFSEDVVAPVERFASHWSHLFPEAKLALALVHIGALEEARLVLRPALREIEWRKQTSSANPSPVPWSPFAYRIDNRRVGKSGWFGVRDDGASSNARDAEQIDTISSDFTEILREATNVAEALSDCFMVRQLMTVEGRILGPVDSGELRDSWDRFHCRPFASRTHLLERRLGVSQELLWALILAESSGNPDSVSHANAYGLMQVIPRTGTRIALGYGEQDFGVHQLLDPRESLKYGSWYLSELLERFDGQEPLALVAYNAGPHQMARWLDWRGEGLAGDLFFETIPFSNSQNYAKKILRLAVTYRYFEDPDALPFIANVLDSEDNDNIYY